MLVDEDLWISNRQYQIEANLIKENAIESKREIYKRKQK
jgi:hypothetical protein